MMKGKPGNTIPTNYLAQWSLISTLLFMLMQAYLAVEFNMQSSLSQSATNQSGWIGIKDMTMHVAYVSQI